MHSDKYLDRPKKPKKIVPEASEIFVRSIPRTRGLPSDEEKMFAERAKNGDARAMDELVLSNISFIRSAAKRAHLRTTRRNEASEIEEEFADSFQTGVEAFLHAISKFKIELDNRICTYAGFWIDQKVTRSLERKLKLRFDSSSIENRADDEDTIVETEDRLISENVVQLIQKSRLTHAEKFVICNHLGLGTLSRKQREIAQVMGISRQKVGEIYHSALEKVKKVLGKRKPARFERNKQKAYLHSWSPASIQA